MKLIILLFTSAIVHHGCTAFQTLPPIGMRPFHSLDAPSEAVGVMFASRKSNNRKQSASTTKGFGVPPPTAEDVAVKFPSRVPDNAEGEDCPCLSHKQYGNCCALHHHGQKRTEEPIDVLRSRYSAFCYRIPLYIMATTHPTCRDYNENRLEWVKCLNRDGMFDSYDFVKLEIGDQESGDNADEAYLDFKVTLRAKAETSQCAPGQELTVLEKSRFLRDGDPLQWRYAGGDVRTDVIGIESVVLNA
jgi:SEC-C motif-containing protein